MKSCSFEGCNNPVFSHSRCKWHYRPFTTINRKSGYIIPKKKESGSIGLKTHKKELLYSFGFRTQKELFDFVWKTREHKCALSGVLLDDVPEWKHHWCMAHILPKKNYPFFKFKEDNILLLHPDVHTMVDNFYEELITKHKEVNFDLWFDMQEQKKQEYSLFLKENMI